MTVKENQLTVAIERIKRQIDVMSACECKTILDGLMRELETSKAALAFESTQYSPIETKSVNWFEIA